MTTATNPDTGERFRLEDGKGVPIKEESVILRTADDVVRAVASGVTFGFADEISGSMRPALGDGAL